MGGLFYVIEKEGTWLKTFEVIEMVEVLKIRLCDGDSIKIKFFDQEAMF
jgi:hypothetical protein